MLHQRRRIRLVGRGRVRGAYPARQHLKTRPCHTARDAKADGPNAGSIHRFTPRQDSFKNDGGDYRKSFDRVHLPPKHHIFSPKYHMMFSL
jgi:hypothetical protein